MILLHTENVKILLTAVSGVLMKSLKSGKHASCILRQ
jgi:hypothetical protein